MVQLLLLLLLLLGDVRTQTTVAERGGGLLAFNTSVSHNGGQVVLGVPFQECGYIFCHAPNVTTDTTTHLWHYHVHWVFPDGVSEDPEKLFILGNNFQMPRAYLVFKGFIDSFSGMYRCVLHHNNTLLDTLTITLNMQDINSIRTC